jgi:ankyrin repeat protein
LEVILDVSQLVENELHEDLVKMAKQCKSMKEDDSKTTSKSHRSADAAYLLSVLLFQGLKGVEHLETGMKWLIKAAEAGSIQARLDLPRVASALNTNLPVNIEEFMIDWLESSAVISVDRFVLDTVENKNNSLYLQLDAQVRKRWMLGPHSDEIFGTSWQLALFDAIDEYTTSADISAESMRSFSSSGEWIHHTVEATLDKFRAFIHETVPENDKMRVLKDYGNGLTWIHFACTLGLIDVLRSIKFNPSIANIQDAQGRTPLIFATACGNAELATFLISVGADASLGHDQRGNTCLHFAQLFRREKIHVMVEQLIQAGGNVNATNNKGETPIHRILQSGMSAESNYTAISTLLRYHADPCIEDEDGELPLFWAITFPQPRSFKTLLDIIRKKLLGKDFNILKANLLDHFMFVPFYERLVFAGQGYSAYLEDMINLLADPETLEEYKSLPDNGGDSAFFAACLRGATDIMKLLPQSCPYTDINEPDVEYLRPPISYAIRHGKQNVFDVLISLGANIFYKDSFDEGALHASVEYAPEMVGQILDIGIREKRLEEMLELSSVHGMTPFDKAIINGQIESAQKILNYGANFNDFRCVLAGGLKWTVLGYILQMQSTSIEQVAFLLDLGAAVVVSEDQTTVFHALAMRSQELQNEGVLRAYSNTRRNC